MPRYDYICLNENCKRPYEYFHLGSNDKEPTCPHCGSKQAEKQVSKATDFQLKGKGWYKDGYKK